MLALEQFASAQEIDGPMLCGCHEPGTRVARDTRLRPLFERGDQSVLCELLGKTDIANDAREAGDEPGRLDPPDCVDRPMCIATGHSYRSHHLPIDSCKLATR